MPSELEQQNKELTIGLDLDDRSAKIVVLSKTPLQTSVENYAVLDSPKKFITSQETAAALRRLVTQLGIENRQVFAAISGSSVYSRRISVPAAEEKQLRDQIKTQAKNLIPFPVDDLIIDYKVIGERQGEEGSFLDIFMVAVQQEFLKQFVAIIEEAGLQIAGVSIAPFALWDLIKAEFPENQGETIALIDFGADISSINIFKDNILQFSREMNTAGDAVTKALTGSFYADKWQVNLTPQQAEAIKVKYGIPEESDTGTTEEGLPLSNIRSIMKPVLRRLQNEIQRSIDYCKDQFAELKIDRLYLTGGSSQLKNMANFISSSFETETSLLDPLKNLQIASNIDQEKLNADKPRITLAIALALGRSSGLNLVHSEEKKEKAPKLDDAKEKIRSKAKASFSLPRINLPKWINWSLLKDPKIFIPMLLLVLAFGFNFYLSKTRDSLRQEAKSKEVILSDLEAIKSRQKVLEKLALEETKVRQILGYLASLIDKKIVLTQLSYNNEKREMLISGASQGTASIGELLTKIESSPYFSQVGLGKISDLPNRKDYKLGFSMTFKVEGIK